MQDFSPVNSLYKRSDMMSNILIVDDEIELCHFLNYLLCDLGHAVTVCTSREDFDRAIMEKEFELAFLDIRLPDRNGLDILQHLKQRQPLCKVVVMTGYGTIKTAVSAIKFGADDFIEKPFDNIEDIELLTEQLLVKGSAPADHEALELASRLNCFIGKNEEMNQLYKLAYKFAKKNVTVLIEGETGTGKEVLAHFIHHASKRAGSPFIGVNCGAIQENLLESELFGHTKGAFTGAAKEKKGYFEQAGKGTLFLDEIGEASLATQVKLLRVLETGEFIKVGGETIKKNQARLIAASHVNLEEAVENGTFREDLLYRIDVVKLTIPPLRKRVEDIPQLVDYYLKQHELGLSFTPDTIECLCKYNWPGNMREFVNMIKRVAALAEGETAIITPHYLPSKLMSNSKYLASANVPTAVHQSIPAIEMNFADYLREWCQQMIDTWEDDDVVDLHHVLQMIKSMEVETLQAIIKKALKRTVGDRKQAAEQLGISLRTLRYYLNEKK